MLSARLTDPFGTPEVVRTAYLIERRLELPGWGEPVFLARSLDSGRRLWLKCSDGSAESSQRLVDEAVLHAKLGHPHILQLAGDGALDPAVCLAYRWEAEAPLSGSKAKRQGETGLLRVAAALLDVVGFLQRSDPPIAHCRLVLDALWVTHEVSWLRVAGFGHAHAGATEEALAADRDMAWRIIRQLAAGGGPQGAEGRLDTLGLAWVEQGVGLQERLSDALKLEMVEHVAADL